MPRNIQTTKSDIIQHHIYISSKNRVPGQSTMKFTVEPIRGIEEAKQFSLDQVSFQNTVFNITKNNNRMVWKYRDLVYDYYFDIQPGYYTHGQLATALQNGFRGLQARTDGGTPEYPQTSGGVNDTHFMTRFYVLKLVDGVVQSETVNTVIRYYYEFQGKYAGSTCYDIFNSPQRKLYRYLFVHAGDIGTNQTPPSPGSFTIKWGVVAGARTYPNIELRDMIGFNSESIGSTERSNIFYNTSNVATEYSKDTFIVGEKSYNLSIGSYIYLVSKALTDHSGSHPHHSGNTPYSHLLAKLPLHGVEFGKMGFYDIQNLYFQWNPSFHTEIDITVLNEHAKLVDNNGGDIELKLTFYMHENPIHS